MERVFISSLARGEMAAIRVAAKAAVESLQMRPVMFETVPASQEDSRSALLDELGNCDLVVLLLGAEYGEAAERGVSPTEDEFEEALRLGIPVIALVQSVARSPEQDEFVARVRGRWAEGHFAPKFNGGDDVALAVVAALNDWRQRGVSSEQQAHAFERARLLVEGSGRPGQSHTGAKARIVLVPVLARAVMDIGMLGEPDLGSDLAMAARASGLVSHDMALGHKLVSDGVELETRNSGGYERLRFTIGRDGAVMAEGAVSGSGLFGSSVIEGPRLRRVIEAASAFAQDVWQRIDRRQDIRQVAVTVGIPDGSTKVYNDTEFTGNSLSVGSFMGGPAVVVAPEPPRIARREDLGSSQLVEALVAEIRHVLVAERGGR